MIRGGGTQALMEKNQDVAICQSYKRIIDENDTVIGLRKCEGLHLMDDDPKRRYKRFLKYFEGLVWDADTVNGFIRSDVLRQTKLLQPFVVSDLALLGNLILLGKLYIIPEELYMRRIHKKTSTGSNPTRLELEKWFDTSIKKSSILPAPLQWGNAFWGHIARMNTSANNKWVCYLLTVDWTILKLIKNGFRKFKKILGMNVQYVC